MIDVNSERSLFINAFLSTQIMNIILKIGDPVLPLKCCFIKKVAFK